MKKILLALLAGAVGATIMSVSAMAAENLGGADFENNTGVVFDGTNYYATLTDAVKGVHGTDDAVLYCKPDADLGSMTHGHVCKDLTVYGNGAYLSGGEKDFEIDFPAASGSSCAGLTGDITLTVDSLAGASAWGSKTSEYAINLVFTNCEEMGKIFFTGTAGAINIDMEDCTFTAESSSCSIYSNTFGEITLDNVDFTGVAQPVALNNKSTGTQVITLTDCDFVDCGADTQDWTVPVSVKSSVAGGTSVLTVDNCTFTGTVTNSIGQDADILLDYGVGNTVANITNTDAKLGVETENNTASYTEVAEDKEYVANNKTETASAPVASADGIKYASLQDAITYAADGAVIDLLGNTINVKDEPADPVNGRRYYAVGGKTITITNGTIDMTGANVSDSVFRLENAADAITFKNIKFVQNEDAANSMTYFINIHTSGNVVEFIDCEFDIAKVSSVIANTAGGVMTVKDCEATVASGNFLYRGNATVENVTFTSENGRFLHANAYPTTIKNSTIVASEIVFIAPEGTLAITENSSVKANAVRHYYDSTNAAYKENVITIDSTSSLEAETLDLALVDTENSAGTIVSKADSIAVEFVKADVDAQGVDNDEDADLYNINLVGANAEIINRLNSADLTFVIENTTGKTAYEIIASNEEVKINPVNNSDNRYEFHYDGKDGVKTDVANVITIGQVKFSGYGIYTFSVDAEAETNVAHATTISDNIVDTFVPNDDDTTVANGELVIENYIKAEILVPTRDLIINIDFPNAINDNQAAYQDMTVTVSGADLETDLVIQLGKNGEITDLDEYITKTSEDKAVTAVFADGAYKVTITDLLNVDTTYTVVVEGAGYRTARYNVTMNCEESKTLNFWNNVKDNAVEVEEDKESSKKNVTFLAGDIVKDAIINIYDLSAVVSYFGEIDLDENNNKTYAKYDLNRDGKIDSKDVAYVLVSWGK